MHTVAHTAVALSRLQLDSAVVDGVFKVSWDEFKYIDRWIHMVPWSMTCSKCGLAP